MKICCVDGCDNPGTVKSKSLYCKSHYHRLNKYGDVHGGRYFPAAKRKWLVENSTYEGDDCIFLPSLISSPGVTMGGVRTNVFRAMCTLAHGPSPEGDYEAAHSCGGRCLTPKHLRWATPFDNTQDKILHGTHGKKHTEETIKEVIRRLSFEPKSIISKRLGVHRVIVSEIASGKKWRHLPRPELPFPKRVNPTKWRKWLAANGLTEND